jgi:hypothetical protein
VPAAVRAQGDCACAILSACPAQKWRLKCVCELPCSTDRFLDHSTPYPRDRAANTGDVFSGARRSVSRPTHQCWRLSRSPRRPARWCPEIPDPPRTHASDCRHVPSFRRAPSGWDVSNDSWSAHLQTGISRCNGSARNTAHAPHATEYVCLFLCLRLTIPPLALYMQCSYQCSLDQ